jgi:hypothetical protein
VLWRGGLRIAEALAHRAPLESGRRTRSGDSGLRTRRPARRRTARRGQGRRASRTPTVVDPGHRPAPFARVAT